MNQYAKYLGKRSFRSKHTQTHTHSRAAARPAPLYSR